MSNWEFWQSVMGNSDDDEDDVFEGFTLEEITKKEESDIDLDIVVNVRKNGVCKKVLTFFFFNSHLLKLICFLLCSSRRTITLALFDIFLE